MFDKKMTTKNDHRYFRRKDWNILAVKIENWLILYFLPILTHPWIYSGLTREEESTTPFFLAVEFIVELHLHY